MKKNTIIVISVTLVIVLIIGVIFAFAMKDNDTPTPTPGTQNDDKMTLDEFSKSEEGRNVSQYLSYYAHIIYTTNKYMELPKTNNDVFYASIEELKKLNYDVSMLDSNCNPTEPIIYFDVNNVMNSSYQGEPVIFKISCTLK